MGPHSPIQFLKGVGPRLGSVLAQRGLATIRDLLLFFPRAYEDRSQVTGLDQLAATKEGQKVTLSLQVLSSRSIPIRKLGRSLLEVRCTDATQSGTVHLKWFRTPYGIERRFTPGTQLVATGTVKAYQGRPEIIHPEVTFQQAGAPGDTPVIAKPAALAPSAPVAESEHHSFGRLVPIYVEIEGIPSRALRSLLWSALDAFVPLVTEDLPEKLRAKHSLPRTGEALRALHFPPEEYTSKIEELLNGGTPFHARFIYEEFLKFEYLVLKQRLKLQREETTAWGIGGGRDAVAALQKVLPFELTRGQKAALTDILRDLAESHPMNRLIQGDVGSGKTAVAFLSAACVMAEGGQAVLMAPTEILAEQHHANAAKLFGGKLRTALLTGRTPGAERKKLLARALAGEPLLLIGTHALIEPDVRFSNLALVLVDEQHRFGVEQRRALKSKGRTPPHTLVLTATPIPRTLALTAYGDLTVSSIRERPPGRTPIVTRVSKDARERAKAIADIRAELQKGHQAYFIQPLVSDSEAEGFEHLKSAVSEAERLQKDVFPDYRVGLLHGQLSGDEKTRIMAEFKSGAIHVLVSTTVVEVGVDVPNATVMVIEHAERFGLSQLHQLRGRVGRGSAQSYCHLFTHPRTAESSSQRLEVLETTEDGFEISEADLKIRGPGDFLGTRQAGELPFKVAQLVRDRDWLIKARDDAEDLLRTDPELVLPEHAQLRRYFEREGALQAERFKTS